MGVGEFAKKMKVSRHTVYSWINTNPAKMALLKAEGVRCVNIAGRIVFELEK